MWRQHDLVQATRSRMILRPAQPQNKWVPSALNTLVKLSEREALVVNALGQRFDIGHPLIFKLYICHGVMWPCHLVRSESDPEHDNSYLWLHPSPAHSYQLRFTTPGKGFIKIPHLFDRQSLRVCSYTIDCNCQSVHYVRTYICMYVCTYLCIHLSCKLVSVHCRIHIRRSIIQGVRYECLTLRNPDISVEPAPACALALIR